MNLDDLPPDIRAALLGEPAAPRTDKEPQASTPDPADVAAMTFADVEELDVGKSPIAATEWDERQVMTFTNVEEPDRMSRIADPG
ncbi:hypothetical protein D7D52_37345 [Nocardia yunnanensis]|uniref:Uncharacterized protein n=1 Tax=Nocardia yunnanensis TaxID=2382165 RepID=A0A386ZMX7_9NOCA|nr:hypothetical protein [Nocardia yunnanensis]AYF78550.1 hypothetical protein D7D52_37345 [Nocardia yunnanensis]